MEQFIEKLESNKENGSDRLPDDTVAEASSS